MTYPTAFHQHARAPLVSPILRDFGDGIYALDSGYFRDEFDAVHLIVENGRIAVVDTSTGNVTGSKGVQGSGPIGTINASSYAIYDQGQRVVFDGAGDNKVKGVLTPKGSGG